jgi:hypothetical protein
MSAVKTYYLKFSRNYPQKFRNFPFKKIWDDIFCLFWPQGLTTRFDQIKFSAKVNRCSDRLVCLRKSLKNNGQRFVRPRILNSEWNVLIWDCSLWLFSYFYAGKHYEILRTAIKILIVKNNNIFVFFHKEFEVQILDKESSQSGWPRCFVSFWQKYFSGFFLSGYWKLFRDFLFIFGKAMAMLF